MDMGLLAVAAAGGGGEVLTDGDEGHRWLNSLPSLYRDQPVTRDYTLQVSDFLVLQRGSSK